MGSRPFGAVTFTSTLSISYASWPSPRRLPVASLPPTLSAAAPLSPRSSSIGTSPPASPGARSKPPPVCCWGCSHYTPLSLPVLHPACIVGALTLRPEVIQKRDRTAAPDRRLTPPRLRAGEPLTMNDPPPRPARCPASPGPPSESLVKSRSPGCLHCPAGQPQCSAPHPLLSHRSRRNGRPQPAATRHQVPSRPAIPADAPRPARRPHSSSATAACFPAPRPPSSALTETPGHTRGVHPPRRLPLTSAYSGLRWPCTRLRRSSVAARDRV